MTGLAQEDIERLIKWLPQVYVAGTARDVARSLDDINQLLELLHQVLVVQAKPGAVDDVQ